MYKLDTTKRFDKALKLCKKRGYLYSQRGAINKKEAGWKTGPPCYFYQNTFTKRSMSTESPTEKVRPVVIAELQ